MVVAVFPAVAAAVVEVVGGNSMTQHIYSRRPSGSSAIPNIIFGLLIANGLIFALQQFQPGLMLRWFALWPVQTPLFMPWQVATYGFMHATGSITHILFNMWMLWMFGRELEQIMGARRFLAYYMVCVVGAALVQLLVGALTGGGAPTVGASGGVFGILLAFGMAFPNRMLMLIFPPIPMRAKYFVVMLGLFELYLGFSGSAPGIANFAHLGGMLFGFLLLRYWQRQRRR